jgi:hypothetical protein
MAAGQHDAGSSEIVAPSEPAAKVTHVA